MITIRHKACLAWWSPPGLSRRRVTAADRKLALRPRFVTAWMDGQFGTGVSRWIYRHRLTHLLLRRWWFWTANRVNEPDGRRFRHVKGGRGSSMA